MMAEIIALHPSWGASQDQWQHFDLVLGLTADLLPVVSNPNAKISGQSTMKSLGKTPSRYNGQREAVGFAQWTQHSATPEEVAAWSRERDYGISLQTRSVRALDVDVPDVDEAAAILEFICARYELPRRQRASSSKFLVAFDCPGELHKRTFKTAHGIVEWLCTGQQFIAAGAHLEKDGVSRSRYEWAGGMPDSFPVLTMQQAEALWSDLASTFGIEPATESQASVKATKLADAAAEDPVAQFLFKTSRVKRTERDGRLHITCPFEAEHTGDSGETSTTYWPAHTGGYVNGHFRCLHAHCEHREDRDFLDAIEYVDLDLMAEFSAIGDAADEPQPIKAEVTIEDKPPAKFRFETAEEFCSRPSPAWIVDGVLPQADLGVVFGEPGAGKTFFLLDLVTAIARGVPWRGVNVERRRVAYVVAEGSAGFRNRMKAYAQQHGISVKDMKLIVLSAAPTLLELSDAKAVALAAHAAGGADILVLDTFAQIMPGGNENSGEDVGKVLMHCRGISKMLGGTMVIAVHHAGKDSSRGARGWSGLKGAADVEIEVLAANGRHVARVTKQKDGESGQEFGFALPKVVLAESIGDDRKEVTSCWVEHTEISAKDLAREKSQLGSVEKLVIDQLAELASLSAEVVDVPLLLEKTRAQLVHDASTGKRDQRNTRVMRALESLQASGRIVVNGVKVSLP